MSSLGSPSMARSLIGKIIGLGALVIVGIFLFKPLTAAFASDVMAPAPITDDKLAATPGTSKTLVLAGGCFWGVQGVYEHVTGVTRAVSGYSGGDRSTAEYETVSTGTTGHAEAVQITYDPSVITEGQLLQIYFSVVTDPTELNHQGPDHGSQYRSTVFVQDADQRAVAQAYILQLEKAKIFSHPIVTTLEPFKAFYPAESYHQDFLTHNPTYPYIVINDMPKVAGLQHDFPALYRADPVLTQ